MWDNCGATQVGDSEPQMHVKVAVGKFKKKSTMARKKRLGVGARVSCKARFLHPSQHIRDKYPNDLNTIRVERLFVRGRAERTISRKVRQCVILQHDDFPDIELYATVHSIRLDVEGPAEHFFDQDATQNAPAAAPAPAAEETAQHQAVNTNGARLSEDDIAAYRSQGVEVDDDNMPAPENMPPAQGTADDGIQYEDWGFDGIDNRRTGNHRDMRPSISGMSAETTTHQTILSWFLLLFPTLFIKNIIIPATNASMGIQQSPLTYGEFLVFIGLWLLMSTQQGCDRRDYWSLKAPNEFEGAPYRFGVYMSRTRFEAILANLRLTNIPAPSFVDKFHEVRQLLKAWNDHMKEVFIPGWINCLDESMSVWTSQWTCPGWMVVPRKPHPFGNEYHTLCCGLCGILYALELVEGKDRPRQMGPQEFDNLGKTVGLLLRLSRSIWNTARVLVLDSGFCVLKALTELRKRGVYAGALIKKRRYWPKYISGDDIIDHFSDKEVGDVDALPGTLDGVPFHVFAMKEPDYTMMIMSTYGTLNEMPDGGTARTYKTSDGAMTTKQFKYCEPFYNHFKYRHLVDDHNGKRHSPISIEETWATKWWPLRVFAFLLAVTEVNAKLAYDFFTLDGKDKLPMLSFRKQLSKALIFNEHIEREHLNEAQRWTSPRNRAHQLEKAPNNTGRWTGTGWKRVKTKYHQRPCKCQAQRVRTHCSCSKEVFYCTCFAL